MPMPRSVLRHLTEGGNKLEEILQPCAPLLEKLRSELGYNALGRKRRDRSLESGERLHELCPEVVELGVSFADIHVAPLHNSQFSRKRCTRNTREEALEATRTLRVSTRMIHTTKAPILVALPFTTVWSLTSTLFAQQALFRSLCSLVSLSRRVIAPEGTKESVERLDMLRWWPEVCFQYGGELTEPCDNVGEVTSPNDWLSWEGLGKVKLAPLLLVALRRAASESGC